MFDLKSLRKVLMDDYDRVFFKKDLLSIIGDDLRAPFADVSNTKDHFQNFSSKK